MTEKINKLKLSIKKDEERIEALTADIKKKRNQIKELEDEQIISTCNIIKANGVNINAVLSAIKNNNTEALQRLMNNKEKNDYE